MGSRELIEALQKTRDGKIDALWTEAKAEASRLRAEAAGRIEALRGSLEARREAAERRTVSRAVFNAEKEARRILLDAERKVSERLYVVAQSLLPELRTHDCEKMFELLLRELPPVSWGEMRVHPGDVEFARKLLPGANIFPAENISGGLDAESEDRRVRMVNTFEKRLERGRRELLPQMMREVYERLSLP